jgi:hypothetical protein
MPSKNVHRFSSYASEHSFRLIQKLSQTSSVGKAGLLEVLVLGMEAKGVDPSQFLAIGIDRRRRVNPDQRRGNREPGDVATVNVATGVSGVQRSRK